MKYFIKILFSLIAMLTAISSAKCQTESDSTDIWDTKFELKFDSANIAYDYNSIKAKNDLSEGIIFLLLPGTIGCPPLTQQDREYEKRFDLRYTCPGCTSFGFQDLAGYNKVIFEYLAKKYGDNWRNGIRLDVAGY